MTMSPRTPTSSIKLLAFGMGILFISGAVQVGAQRVGIEDLPSCALPCATTAALAVSCNLNDNACLCAHPSFTQATLQCSRIGGQCPIEDRGSVVGVLSRLCAGLPASSSSAANSASRTEPGSTGLSTGAASTRSSSSTPSGSSSPSTTSSTTPASTTIASAPNTPATTINGGSASSSPSASSTVVVVQTVIVPPSPSGGGVSSHGVIGRGSAGGAARVVGVVLGGLVLGGVLGGLGL